MPSITINVHLYVFRVHHVGPTHDTRRLVHRTWRGVIRDVQAYDGDREFDMVVSFSIHTAFGMPWTTSELLVGFEASEFVSDQANLIPAVEV